MSGFGGLVWCRGRHGYPLYGVGFWLLYDALELSALSLAGIIFGINCFTINSKNNCIGLGGLGDVFLWWGNG